MGKKSIFLLKKQTELYSGTKLQQLYEFQRIIHKACSNLNRIKNSQRLLRVKYFYINKIMFLALEFIEFHRCELPYAHCVFKCFCRFGMTIVNIRVA